MNESVINFCSEVIFYVDINRNKRIKKFIENKKILYKLIG